MTRQQLSTGIAHIQIYKHQDVQPIGSLIERSYASVDLESDDTMS